MAGTIQGYCLEGRPNTGLERCPKKEGKALSVILTDPTAKYTMEAEDFQKGINGWIGSTGILRMYPVGNIMEITPTGGDVAVSEIGFSGPQPIGINAYNELYRIDASDCLYKELSKLNRRKMRLFRVDDDNYIYGTARTVQGEEFFTGFDVTVFVYRQQSNGTDPYSLYLAVYYSANYEKEQKNLNAFALEGQPVGLIGVELEKGTNGVKVVAGCSGTDYTAVYGEEWKANMFINNSGTAATSVAYDEENEVLKLTPAGSYRIADATVLAAGNIYDLEGTKTFVAV